MDCAPILGKLGPPLAKTTTDPSEILAHRFKMLGTLATGGDEKFAKDLVTRYSGITKKSSADVASIHDFELLVRDRVE